MGNRIPGLSGFVGGSGSPNDYRKFKTPFFKISIATASNLDFIELPFQLQRLASSFELTEVLKSSNEKGTTTATINFVEGSREPYPRGEQTPVYDEGNFSFGNDSGLLTDLQFTNTGVGIKELLDVDVEQGIKQVSEALSAFSSDETESPDEQFLKGESSALEVFEKSNIKEDQFLFDAGNLIKVNWGYVEDPNTQRSWIGVIKVVRNSFPEADQPTLEVIAVEPRAPLDDITPKTARVFKKDVFSTDIEGLSVKEIVETICEESGFECIISDDLKDAGKPDDGRPIVWPSGVSADQFLCRLADRTNSVYRAFYDSASGGAVIYFLRRAEHGSFSFLSENLFTYKGPNSIIKSVVPAIELQGNTSSSVKTVTESGKIVDTEGEVTEEINIYEGEKRVDVDARKPKGADKTAVAVSKSTPNERAVGDSEYRPDNNTSVAQGISNSKTGSKNACNIMIEFNAIGHPGITTGVLPFGGIGVRFNGKYNIRQVTHNISANGYNCQGTGIKASSQTASDQGGINSSVSDQGKGKEKARLFTQKLGINVDSEESSDPNITDLIN